MLRNEEHNKVLASTLGLSEIDMQRYTNFIALTSAFRTTTFNRRLAHMKVKQLRKEANELYGIWSGHYELMKDDLLLQLSNQREKAINHPKIGATNWNLLEVMAKMQLNKQVFPVRDREM